MTVVNDTARFLGSKPDLGFYCRHTKRATPHTIRRRQGPIHRGSVRYIMANVVAVDCGAVLAYDPSVCTLEVARTYRVLNRSVDFLVHYLLTFTLLLYYHTPYAVRCRDGIRAVGTTQNKSRDGRRTIEKIRVLMYRVGAASWSTSMQTRRWLSH